MKKSSCYIVRAFELIFISLLLAISQGVIYILVGSTVGIYSTLDKYLPIALCIVTILLTLSSFVFSFIQLSYLWRGCDGVPHSDCWGVHEVFHIAFMGTILFAPFCYIGYGILFWVIVACSAVLLVLCILGTCILVVMMCMDKSTRPPAAVTIVHAPRDDTEEGEVPLGGMSNRLLLEVVNVRRQPSVYARKTQEMYPPIVHAEEPVHVDSGAQRCAPRAPLYQ